MGSWVIAILKKKKTIIYIFLKTYNHPITRRQNINFGCVLLQSLVIVRVIVGVIVVANNNPRVIAGVIVGVIVGPELPCGWRQAALRVAGGAAAGAGAGQG